MSVLARPPLSPLRRARQVALVAFLFVALPFSAMPLVGAATVERSAPDDAPDAESDAVNEARPARSVRAGSAPVPPARPRPASVPPVCRPAPAPLPLPPSAACDPSAVSLRTPLTNSSRTGTRPRAWPNLRTHFPG